MQRMRKKQTNRTGWSEVWWTYLSQVLKRGINLETVWGKTVSRKRMKPCGTSLPGGAGVHKVKCSR